jgi:orotidine-5'-phosphate decarboxylase
MTQTELFNLIKKKRSFLCIGLDTDSKKIPPHLLDQDDPVFSFNKAIIDATQDLAVAYKPNLAFYESLGKKGWESLEKTINYLNQFDVFTIADAKRGDIGNTSAMYARAFFEHLNFDAITVAPYMGSDSVSPFLSYNGKWVIVLALTSNQGAFDFQMKVDRDNGNHLYQDVILQSSQWGTPDNTMYVVGATKAEMLKDIRALIPNHFLLVPGVGAQGGNLEDVAKNGINEHCGLLVNSSRGIIYASSDKDYPDRAREKAMEIRNQMEQILHSNKLIA